MFDTHVCWLASPYLAQPAIDERYQRDVICATEEMRRARRAAMRRSRNANTARQKGLLAFLSGR